MWLKLVSPHHSQSNFFRIGPTFLFRLGHFRACSTNPFGVENILLHGIQG